MKPLIMLLLLLFTFPSAAALADIEESLGRSLVKRSLNKKIIVTPRRTWTEHRAGDTGIDRIIVSCPTDPKRRKQESTRDYRERLREFDFQSLARCR
jgi:hypothetical protein